MPLLRKRRLRRPRLPEAVAVAAVLAATAAAIAWLNAATCPPLEPTIGAIVACDVYLTHYNADDFLPKVVVDYTYAVGIGAYAGHWEGFWPATDSPDALPPAKLDLLKQPGRPVTVFYDPAEPQRSFLHSPRRSYPAPYALAAAAVTLAAAFYLLRIYPSIASR